VSRFALCAFATVVFASGCGSPAPTGLSSSSSGSPTNQPPSSVAALAVTVRSTIPLSGFPGGPTVASGALWYWDETTGKVVRVDSGTNHVVATISLGDPGLTPYGSPKAVAANGQVIWVTDVVHHAVDRIDPATNRIADQIVLDAGAGPSISRPIDPFGLALDGSGLWISDFDQGLVLRLDTKSKRVTSVVADVDHPEGLAIGFGSVWVVEHRKAALARIDLSSETVSSTIALPGSGPDPVCGMCVDTVVSSQDGIWVPLDLGKGIVRIDPATNSVSAQIQLGRVVDSLAVGGGAIWVAAWDGSIPCTDTGAVIARIDVATNGLKGTSVIPCAVTVAVADGDVWAGTADAPNGVMRLAVGP
jgi:streptogramin lyase